jgi:hypothetical protein
LIITIKVVFDCLHSQSLVFDSEFADLAEDFGVFLELVNWIKSELELDEKELFYYLATNMHSVTFDDSILTGGL